MKKKYLLLLIPAFLIPAISLILFFIATNNNDLWYSHLEYSPPLTTVLELEAVTMNYSRTEITHVGNVIIATVVNNSDYWIIREGLGSFYHDTLTTKLEFYDGYNWRLVPSNRFPPPPPPPSMALPHIPPGESLEIRFSIEFFFGLLQPGLYRIRVQYVIYAGANLYRVKTIEEQQRLFALSQRLGPHDIVAEFYWDLPHDE